MPQTSAFTRNAALPSSSAGVLVGQDLALQTSELLLQIEGLDVASALPRLQFRLDRYQSLLQRFVQGQGDALPQVRRALSEGRHADALRMLHTLKGTAATIGARALAHHAEAAEKALQTSTAPEALQALLQTTEDSCNGLVAALRSVLSALSVSDAAAPEAGTGAHATPDNPEAAHDALHRMMLLVEQDSPDAVDVLQQSEAALRRHLGAAFAPLAEALTQYDFETGRELLQQALSAKNPTPPPAPGTQ